MMKQETIMTMLQTTTSPGIASQTGRPAPEELVPSRYVQRIGEIEVLVISDGVLPLPTKMLAHNADPAARAREARDPQAAIGNGRRSKRSRAVIRR